MKKRTIEGVLAVHEPEGEEAPAVFDSPHSGFGIPDDFGTILSERILWDGGVDNFVDELFSDAPAYGGHLLEALYLRSYVDPNRDTDEIDPDLLDGPWPDPVRPSTRTNLGTGLIWSKDVPNLPLYDRKLSVAEARRRIDRYWKPYQAELAGLLEAKRKRFGAVYFLDCHSHRAVAPPNMFDREGTSRAEMDLGTLDGAACSPEFTDVVRTTLEECGYQVVVDGDHKGEHLIRHTGDPARGSHAIMLEIRKDLYMDQDTISHNNGFDETRANMAKLAQAICDFAKNHVRSL
jgi:N-formylglutamate amidohydrolase